MRRCDWSAAEDEAMLVLADSGQSFKEIALIMAKTGSTRSYTAVRNRWRRLRYKPAPIAFDEGQKELCEAYVEADKRVLLRLARCHPERMQEPSKRPGTERPRVLAPAHIARSADKWPMPASPEGYWR